MRSLALPYPPPSRPTTVLAGAILALLLLLPILLDRWAGQAAFDLFLLAGVGILVIAATGQQLLSGVSGQPSLGGAAFFGAGGYGLAILLARYTLPLWLALPLAVLAAALAGLVAGLPALRVRGAYLAVATLALVFIAQDLMGQYQTQTLQSSSLAVPRPSLLTGDTSFYYFTLAVTALALLLARNLLAGRTGRAFAALRESEPAAQTLGVPAGRTRALAFVLGAALTGLAGALQTLQQGSVASSAFGLDLSVLLLSAVVVGGSGRLSGAILGGCLMAGVADLFRYKLPATLGPVDVAAATPIIYSLLIIVAVARFPGGLAGALDRGPEAQRGD